GLAGVLKSQSRYDEARSHLRSALQLKPTVETRLQLAALHYQTGEFQEAVTQLQQAVQAKGDLPEALNNLAWLLATCADDHTRNGVEAVRSAERACHITGFKNANC